MLTGYTPGFGWCSGLGSRCTDFIRAPAVSRESIAVFLVVAARQDCFGQGMYSSPRHGGYGTRPRIAERCHGSCSGSGRVRSAACSPTSGRTSTRFRTGLPATAALFAAVPQGTNAGRGSNTKGSSNIITNGSKIVVPEGYGLLLFQDGAITGFAAEPGGYEWQSDDLNSKSIFAGDGLVDSLIKQSWERFKFGGQPGSQQAAFFVSLKELPDNRFGTQSEIYWDDGFLNTQVGAVTRGSYTLKIVDPILFVKNFVPAALSAARQGVRFHRHGQCRRRPALQRSGRFARAGLQPVHERSRQGQSHHQAAAGFDRIRQEPVRCGGECLPVELRSRPGHRQDRHRFDRVRREHAGTAQDRAARRCAVRFARQFQPAGQRRAGHPVGRRKRRCGGPRWASAWRRA